MAENNPYPLKSNFDFLNNDLSRLDKNIMTASGLQNLQNQFGAQTQLVLSIMLFIGKKYKENFFNMCTFTLQELAKGINVSPKYLSTKYELPKGSSARKVWLGLRALA